MPLSAGQWVRLHLSQACPEENRPNLNLEIPGCLAPAVNPTRLPLANPQKWNKYAYVLNNPHALVDPNGMEEVTI